MTEPDWVEVLRRECADSSQVRVAEALGVSATVVNQLLKGAYKGDLARMRGLVEGAFMARTVACPVLGELALNRCLGHQREKFSGHNPVRVRLARACPGCGHNQTGR